MAVRAFFSGVESAQHFDHCVKAGVKHVLFSYLQFYKHDPGIIKKRKLKNPDMQFMVDSGAFTFITEWQKFTTWSRADFEGYLQGYVDWLKANRRYVSIAVEFDIDHTLNMVLGGNANSTIGGSMVQTWQEKHFRPLVEDGLDIIFVWHENRGMDGWEEMCRRYSHVGMPGHFSSEPDVMNRHVSVAKRYLTKIHGFAASVSGDSKLILKTDGGLRTCSIEELFHECSSTTRRGDEEWGRLPFSCRTWSLTDTLQSTFEVVTSVVRHQVTRPLYEIRLRGGKMVRGTGDHSFFSLDAAGNLLEVKPENLSVGDYLVSSLGIPPKGCASETSSTLRIAEFLGVWFGDGYVNQRNGVNDTVWVSKQHQPEIRRLCTEVAALFSGKWSLANEVDGYTYSPELGELLAANFGRVGPEKYLGNFVLNASPQWQAAFLRGYFSADGSAKGNNKLISLTCVKREPLEMVQLLLEQWDIRSGLSRETRKTGKGSEPCWELAISDGESRSHFADTVGFLQADQNVAIAAKETTKTIAGVHRGLPVTLLRSGRIFRMSNGVLTGRPVYSKDRRTAELPENFCLRLLEMQCEYLEIASIRQLPAEKVWVYDLEVPTTQRFFANGILAHNTKQLDFRDMPWFTVDSITWKTGEMYGTLIVWDERQQKLIFEDDKSKRSHYRHIIERAGFDATSIIADTNYKEVTRFGLWSMRQMELFYERQYRTRPFYYEVRLPHWQVVMKRMKDKRLMRWWLNKLRSEDLFKQHAKHGPHLVRQYLAALAAAQYGDLNYIRNVQQAQDFLACYWPTLIKPLINDPAILQKEVANYVIPPNPPPLLRTGADHFAVRDNPPKARDSGEWSVDDLEFKPYVEDLATLE